MEISDFNAIFGGIGVDKAYKALTECLYGYVREYGRLQDPCMIKPRYGDLLWPVRGVALAVYKCACCDLEKDQSHGPYHQRRCFEAALKVLVPQFDDASLGKAKAKVLFVIDAERLGFDLVHAAFLLDKAVAIGLAAKAEDKAENSVKRPAPLSHFRVDAATYCG